jgi:protein-S-isoprenylcysteine O-methyltransferase Ste14
MIWRYLIEGPWIVFAGYWVASALKTRKTVSQESLASRFGFLFLEILGFVLLFSGLAEVSVLGHLVVPRTNAVAVTGVALTWIGLAVGLWARWHLGQYWSAKVALKEGHKLIRTGPYAHIRHPIYSGIIAAALGGYGDRQMAMRCGSRLDRPGLLHEGEERRVPPGHAIRRSLQRALPGDGFPVPEVLVRGCRSLSGQAHC